MNDNFYDNHTDNPEGTTPPIEANARPVEDDTVVQPAYETDQGETEVGVTQPIEAHPTMPISTPATAPTAQYAPQGPIGQEQPFYQENMGRDPMNPPYSPPAQSMPRGYGTQGTPGWAPPQQQPRKKRRAVAAIACVLAVCLVFGGLSMVFGAYDSRKETLTENTTNGDSAQLDVNKSPVASDTKGNTEELSTVGLVNKVEASCVGIVVKTVTNNTGAYGSLGENTTTGEGSGVLMLEDKAKGLTYVVTCAHVISAANSSFTIILDDKKEYEATLVGYDAQTDIGVLSIQATGLSIASFGDSDALQKGQSILAIGNPGGSAYANSATEGIISAIDRPVGSSIGYKTNSIQHSAPINPGNSGGALFNFYGQVVGINSSKIASTEYEGMGFAVPSKTVQEVVNNLIANGYMAGRAQLGIQYNTISNYQNYAQLVAAGMPEGSIVIVTLNEGSAFAGTQVQQFDVIVAVNGTKMTSTDVLTSALSGAAPGDTLKLSMARMENGRINNFEVSVVLKEARN